MAKFKVSKVVKKTASTTLSVGKRMKQAAMKAKEKAEKTEKTSQKNPVQYAEEKVTDTAEKVVLRGSRFLGKIFRTTTRKALQHRPKGDIKPNSQPTAPAVSEEILTPDTVAGQKRSHAQSGKPPTPASSVRHTNAQYPRDTSATPKMRRDHARGQSSKQKTLPSAKPVKRLDQSIQSGLKSTERTLKTGRQTLKTGANATKTTAQTAHRTAQTAMKLSQNITQTAAKAATKGIQAAAKAAAAAIKAMIAAAQSLVVVIAAGGGVVLAALLLVGAIAFIVVSPLGIFFSGGIGTEVKQSLPKLIYTLNNEYTEKVDEIKAISHDYLELSISRGPWSEMLAVYAIVANTNPDNPLEVVTMDEEKEAELRQIYWQMCQLSYTTEQIPETGTAWERDENDELVLVEVTVYKTKLIIYGTFLTAYDIAATLDFTEHQYEWLGELLSPDYALMWQSVLYGNSSIVSVALAQLGNVGGDKFWQWYGFESRVEWCACFVSWCANECGYLDTGILPMFASCSAGITWFQDRERWQESDYIPAPGDLIFFDWEVDGVVDHVGIVNYAENGMVYTVEGNSSDSCREKSYALDSSIIVGYGVFSP